MGTSLYVTSVPLICLTLPLNHSSVYLESDTLTTTGAASTGCHRIRQ